MNRNVERRRRTRPFLLLLAGLAVAAAVLVAATIGTAARAVAPDNTAPPTISGTARVGSTLTANNGTWSGTAPITFTYQWRRCDKDGGSCSDISGATEKTYELKSPDQGNTLRARVNARNNDGTTSESTVPTAVVGAAEPSTPDTGCPNAPAGSTVKVADVKPPARLVVDKFVPSPSTIGGSFTS